MDSSSKWFYDVDSDIAQESMAYQFTSTPKDCLDNTCIILDDDDDDEDDEDTKCGDFLADRREMKDYINLPEEEEDDSKQPLVALDLTNSKMKIDLTNEMEPLDLSKKNDFIDLTQLNDSVDNIDSIETIDLTRGNDSIDLIQTEEIIDYSECNSSIDLSENSEPAVPPPLKLNLFQFPEPAVRLVFNDLAGALCLSNAIKPLGFNVIIQPVVLIPYFNDCTVHVFPKSTDSLNQAKQPHCSTQTIPTVTKKLKKPSTQKQCKRAKAVKDPSPPKNKKNKRSPSVSLSSLESSPQVVSVLPAIGCQRKITVSKVEEGIVLCVHEEDANNTQNLLQQLLNVI